MRRIWSVFLPLALMACAESPTGVRGDELVLQVQDSEANSESAAVQGVQGGVAVSGVYVAPGSGYTLRAAYHTGRGGEVTLFVSGFPPDVSLGVISGHAYRATVPLPSGVHTVTVVHFDQRTSGGGRTVATGEVTVARS